MVSKISFFAASLLTLFFIVMFFMGEQRESSDFENRTMATFPHLTVSAFVDGSFQTELESALKDQVYQRDAMIRLSSQLKTNTRRYYNAMYDQLFMRDTELASDEAIDASTDVEPANAEISEAPDPPPYKLTPVGELYKIEGTENLIEYPLLPNDKYTFGVDVKVLQFEEMKKRHPDLKFYAYYVTKGEDLNWFDQTENIRSFDPTAHLASSLPSFVRYDYLKYETNEDYAKYNYKTDHHWNYEGAYEGYKDIYNMMAQDFELSEMLVPKEELTFNEEAVFIGSYGGPSGGAKLEPDVFKAYDFGLSGYESYFGDEQTDLGNADQYKQGIFSKNIEENHFMQYYGSHESRAVIKHVFPENELNLIFIGDSNNRSIRREIASHFHTTFFIEYRLMFSVDIDQMIEEHDIDAILFFGQNRYWLEPQYYFNNYPYPGK